MAPVHICAITRWNGGGSTGRDQEQNQRGNCPKTKNAQSAPKAATVIQKKARIAAIIVVELHVRLQKKGDGKPAPNAGKAQALLMTREAIEMPL
jgi:hypothetical protein